jgi:hypothetical protein
MKTMNKNILLALYMLMFIVACFLIDGLVIYSTDMSVSSHIANFLESIF